MGNTLIRSYSQNSLFLFLIFQAPRNDYPLRRNDNPPERQTIPANIPITVVARRRMIISHNNDIVQVLLNHARSINQMILVVSGQGYLSEALFSPPGDSFQYVATGRRRQIFGISGIIQPRQMVVPNVTLVSASFLAVGEVTVHRLITSGEVELEAVFYTGGGPMFERDAVDGPEASNAIRYLD